MVVVSPPDDDPICVVALLVSPRRRLSRRTSVDNPRPLAVCPRPRRDGFYPFFGLRLAYVSSTGIKRQLGRGVTGSRSCDMIFECGPLPLPVFDQAEGG